MKRSSDTTNPSLRAETGSGAVRYLSDAGFPVRRGGRIGSGSAQRWSRCADRTAARAPAQDPSAQRIELRRQSCTVRFARSRFDADSRGRSLPCAEDRRRMRDRHVAMAECEALHLQARAGAGEQGFWWTRSVLENAPFVESCRCGAAIGRSDDGQDRHRARSVLSSIVVARGQGQGGDRHSAQDRGCYTTRCATDRSTRIPALRTMKSAIVSVW